MSCSYRTLPIFTLDVHAHAGYDWSKLPNSAAGTNYQVMMCRKGTYVTSLTVYVSSNHYTNTGNPNYLGACPSGRCRTFQCVAHCSASIAHQCSTAVRLVVQLGPSPSMTPSAGAGGFGIQCSDGSVNSYVLPGIQSYQAFASGPQGFANISGWTGAPPLPAIKTSFWCCAMLHCEVCLFVLGCGCWMVCCCPLARPPAAYSFGPARKPALHA